MKQIELGGVVVEKDVIDWGAITSIEEHLEWLRSLDKNGNCEFRYDYEADAIYTENITRARYTYIAMSSIPGVYKVGRTQNLRQRAKTLNEPGEPCYSLLGLTPIAYCVRDIESLMKMLLPCKKRKLPEPFSSATELLLVDHEDIVRLMNMLDFKEIGTAIPGDIFLTKRNYYDPRTGEYTRTTTTYTISI